MQGTLSLGIMASTGFITLFLLGFCLVTLGRTVQDEDITPAQLTKLVGDQMLKHQLDFFQWHYGGALIFEGLFQASQAFGLPYTDTLNKYLDDFKTNEASLGYKILHNITVPWYHNIGDDVGLFPIAYLNRAWSQSGKVPGYDNSTDMYIVKQVVNKYLLGWPVLTADGTVCRREGWKGQTGDQFLWIDDMYMGLTLVARLGRTIKDPQLLNWVLEQQILFASHLQDPADGCFRHGFNAKTSSPSCCKWGRGSGWALMSQYEALTFKNEPWAQELGLHQDPKFMKVQDILRSHAKCIAKNQSPDGRWHQVVNETSTYLETSGSAMALSTLIRGSMFGFIDYTMYRNNVELGWKGIQKTIAADGVVHGVCVGTGIQASVAAYEARPTDYLMAGDGGLGSILYALVDYDYYKKAELDGTMGRMLRYPYRP